jgi:hypothetical protein
MAKQRVLCYIVFMTKHGLRGRGNGKKKRGMTLGQDRFAKISAVEGIQLTAAMRKRAAAFDRQGTPAAARRRAIMQAHSKG